MIRINKICDTDFQLINIGDEHPIHQFNKCGLLMDSELSIAFKWGDYDVCEREFHKMLTALPLNHSKKLALLDVSELDQVELDKMVDICDYCGVIFKKFTANE